MVTRGGPLRILIFSWKDAHHPWAGGSEVNMHEQARRWIEQGHEVTLFTSRPRGSRRRDNIDGIEVYRAGGRFSPFLLAPLFYLALLRKRADVILDIINGIPFFTPAYAAKPVVGLIHHVHRDMFVPELGPLVGRVGIAIEQYLVPLLYRKRPVICISESTAGEIRSLLHRGDEMHVRVIYNGIDGSLYSPGTGEKFESPTVLYLGRLKPYKRLPRLIRMMPEVRDRVPDAELFIAGAGEAILEAEAEVKLLGAEEYVRFLWEVTDDEKVGLYRLAWVTATASMVEGWGLTVIEANACGTPAVAFNVPGLNESIVHGQTGMLARDDKEFIEHLVAVLTDAPLRHRLAAGAVEWSNKFSWDVTASNTLDILEEAVERNAG
jgi:glycosyltransferase involved in cell wall biosynthesis